MKRTPVSVAEKYDDLYLEEVRGEQALAWVAPRNEFVQKKLQSEPHHAEVCTRHNG